eukprot:g844.t1
MRHEDELSEKEREKHREYFRLKMEEERRRYEREEGAREKKRIEEEEKRLVHVAIRNARLREGLIETLGDRRCELAVEDSCWVIATETEEEQQVRWERISDAAQRAAEMASYAQHVAMAAAKKAYVKFYEADEARERTWRMERHKQTWTILNDLEAQKKLQEEERMSMRGEELQMQFFMSREKVELQRQANAKLARAKEAARKAQAIAQGALASMDWVVQKADLWLAKVEGLMAKQKERELEEQKLLAEIEEKKRREKEERMAARMKKKKAELKAKQEAFEAAQEAARINKVNMQRWNAWKEISHSNEERAITDCEGEANIRPDMEFRRKHEEWKAWNDSAPAETKGGLQYRAGRGADGDAVANAVGGGVAAPVSITALALARALVVQAYPAAQALQRVFT